MLTKCPRFQNLNLSWSGTEQRSGAMLGREDVASVSPMGLLSSSGGEEECEDTESDSN